MVIIVGLGNPGDEYKDTFHNLGFMALDTLAEKLNKKIKKIECSSLTEVFSRKGEKVVLAKPLTFMNLSGQAVKSLMAKYKAEASDIIVLYDDFDIDRFSLRARENGSAGSHNGMKSIINLLGTEEFKRIRIGFGGNNIHDKKDYVLSSIKKEDKDSFQNTFDALARAIIAYFDDKDFNRLMRSLNTSHK